MRVNASVANNKLTAKQSLFTGLGSKVQGASQGVTNLLDNEKKKNTITVLDGIRGLACFLVIFYHLNLVARNYHIWLPIRDFGSIVGSIALFGQSGVILFFTLSGFLLFLPYAKSMLLEREWPSARLFYLKRAFRIMPGYYISLFLLTPLMHPEYLQKSHWGDLWLFMTFRMDFPQTFQKINGPYWTLAIEAQFYVVLPLLAWAMSSIVCRGKMLHRTIWLTICVCAIIAWGLLSRYWGLHWNSLYASKTAVSPFLLPPSFAAAIKPYIVGTDGKYFEDFGIGMLIAVAYVYSQNTAPNSWWNKGICRISPLLFIAAIAILFFTALWHFYTWYPYNALHFLDQYHEALLKNWGEWEPLCSGIGYGLFMCALLYGPNWLVRPWEWAPLRWIGLSSYSLYIWHLPLMMIFVYDTLPDLQASGMPRLTQYGILSLWTLLVIVPFCLAIYLLIEKPGIRLGEITRRKFLKERKRQTIALVTDTPVLDRPLESAMPSRRD